MMKKSIITILFVLFCFVETGKVYSEEVSPKMKQRMAKLEEKFTYSELMIKNRRWTALFTLEERIKFNIFDRFEEDKDIKFANEKEEKKYKEMKSFLIEEELIEKDIYEKDMWEKNREKLQKKTPRVA